MSKQKQPNLVAMWSRETLEKAYWDALKETEGFADGYSAMFDLSASYELALTDIKKTAGRTDIPAGDALFLICIRAEEALERALPRAES